MSNTQSAVHSRGLTLIEVIVTIAIVSVLAALTLAGVQSAREAARKSTCQHRLRQLALAVQGFEACNKQFPPGILGVDRAFPHRGNYHEPESPYCWRKFQYTSFLGLVLPQLEEHALYDAVEPIMFDLKHSLVDDPRVPVGSMVPNSFLDIASAVHLAERDPSIFHCPSDTLPRFAPLQMDRVGGAVQPVLFGENADDRLGWINLAEYDEHEFAHASYAGCLGAHSGGIQPDPVKHGFRGLMSSREKIRPGDCVDGLSRTVLIGETLGHIESGVRTLVSSWLFGAVARGRGGVPWKAAPTEQVMLGDDKNAFANGFASVHSAGVYMAHGDGHVTFVDRGIDWMVWYHECGIADQKFQLE